jgi:hypothetical protein
MTIALYQTRPAGADTRGIFSQPLRESKHAAVHDESRAQNHELKAKNYEVGAQSYEIAAPRNEAVAPSIEGVSSSDGRD